MKEGSITLQSINHATVKLPCHLFWKSFLTLPVTTGYPPIASILAWASVTVLSLHKMRMLVFCTLINS